MYSIKLTKYWIVKRYVNECWPSSTGLRLSIEWNQHIIALLLQKPKISEYSLEYSTYKTMQ